ncbi:D-beta-hydroxybutyrate dehydrogenase, mitochondrial [Diorhabda sublineata]|uniref:D-beta-hydroxybutyrate dehydrogenase, mitochondrial n=1 Tax=Diorhabda sublineata TaxID=1163346 RepID=UPI0024E12ABB|nr:D-beta-hydroxybutyrate dehydrogenase, mitochondrial [Diorhabda sublineata]
MEILSKYSLVTFEILNEMYVAIGTGVLGILYLLKKGFHRYDTIRTLTIVSLTTVSVAYVNKRNRKQLQANKTKVVCITGCDSGLGFSLAQHTVDMGFTVIAGFLSLESKGCKDIRQKYGKNIIQIQLDITDTNSVRAAVQTIEHFLTRNSGYSLHAIINNAGIMVFGEFEWLTENLIHQQVELNLMGTLRFTNAFCPLLRLHQGRVITVTSHCAQAALPGIAVYGATKAALSAFNDGFRTEMSKYGVKVIQFIPGSFTLQSNIMAKQLQYVQEMHDNFTPEQHAFYSDYFKAYNIYLSFLTPPPSPIKIDDPKLYIEYEKTLLDEHPCVVYKNENWRYWFYHNLFKFSPWFLRDYFVLKFMSMPNYVPSDTNISSDSYDGSDDLVL